MDTLKDLVELIGHNWSVLASAPLTFVSFLILAFILSYAAGKWRYEGILDSLRERIEGFKEQLSTKDRQLDEYRARLQLTDKNTTALGQLSNLELRERALDVAGRLQRMLASASQAQVRQYSAPLRDASELERQRAWDQSVAASLTEAVRVQTEYEAGFRSDMIVLRDELLSRLSPNAKREYEMYEHPTNLIGMRQVAADLERLAKSLPPK